jgi:hypothetical protein
MRYLWRLDEWLIDLYQARIADPLQYRGVTLLAQFVTCNSLAFVVLTFRLARFVIQGEKMLAVFNFLFMLSILASALWPDVDGRGERLDPSDSIFRNPNRYSPILRWGRIAWLFLVLAEGVGFGLPYWVALWVLLASLADACDPKKPRPKKQEARLPLRTLVEVR